MRYDAGRSWVEVVLKQKYLNAGLPIKQQNAPNTWIVMVQKTNDDMR
jgi:hypothetical protein